MTLIPSQRHLFDIPEDITYINCAYMSPLMLSVALAGRESIDAKVHPWGMATKDFFGPPETARALAGQILNASVENMAIVPSVSYGLATAAQNVPLVKGQNIIALQDQFPSNIYIWKEKARACNAEFRLLPQRQDGDWTATLMSSIDEATAIVALPHCHWTDGSLIDLVKIGKRAREVGAALILDLAQSAGAMPISMAQVEPDFAVFPTYKWAMGPYALGFLYVADKWVEKGTPLEQTWTGRQDSENFSELVNYKDEFQPGARRFDMGQRANFHLIPMAIAALQQLLDWGIENIYETLTAKNEAILAAAEPLGLRAAPTHLRAGHYLGLRFPESVPPGLIERLAERKIYISLRGNSVRVTPHLYNSEDDAERLLSALN
jgi:selenocysteine lyase/cysteine desulfurase